MWGVAVAVFLLMVVLSMVRMVRIAGLLLEAYLAVPANGDTHAIAVTRVGLAVVAMIMMRMIVVFTMMLRLVGVAFVIAVVWVFGVVLGAVVGTMGAVIVSALHTRAIDDTGVVADNTGFAVVSDHHRVRVVV